MLPTQDAIQSKIILWNIHNLFLALNRLGRGGVHFENFTTDILNHAGHSVYAGHAEHRDYAETVCITMKVMHVIQVIWVSTRHVLKSTYSSFPSNSLLKAFFQIF